MPSEDIPAIVEVTEEYEEVSIPLGVTFTLANTTTNDVFPITSKSYSLFVVSDNERVISNGVFDIPSFIEKFGANK